MTNPTVPATVALALFLLGFPQAREPKPSMIAPKITHHDEAQTQHYDRIEITCPEGYEGHFVDVGIGFGPGVSWSSFTSWGELTTPGYVVCFDKAFMDQIRAKPELLQPRPAPPRPV